MAEIKKHLYITYTYICMCLCICTQAYIKLFQTQLCGPPVDLYTIRAIQNVYKKCSLFAERQHLYSCFRWAKSSHIKNDSFQAEQARSQLKALLQSPKQLHPGALNTSSNVPLSSRGSSMWCVLCVPWINQHYQVNLDRKLSPLIFLIGKCPTLFKPLYADYKLV